MAEARPASTRKNEDGGAFTVSHPDLEWRETVRGAKPGDRYVRIATHKGFTRLRRGYLVTRPGTGEPQSGVGLLLQRFKHVVLGSPIPTAVVPRSPGSAGSAPSQCQISAVVITNADRFSHIVDEDLPIADFAGFRRTSQGPDDFLGAA